MTVLEEIRRATKPSHDALESGLDVLARLTAAGGRRSLLADFYALYAPAEAVLSDYLHAVPGLRYRERLKTPVLLSGLTALGAGSAELGRIPFAEMPNLSGIPNALGFAYVLEGATLGGRVIFKQLTAAGVPLLGLGFFDVYGSETGARWREFCAVLERECRREACDAVDGARAGFEYVSAGLAEPQVAA